MKCIRGSFKTVNEFITEDLISIFVYPYDNLWPLIKDTMGYDVFIRIDKYNVVSEVVVY